jgi:predicted nuclease of predicted toxin-antitoxin system
VRLYLDENLSPPIADRLRARGLDVVSACEAGNTQLDDRAQLRYATGQGRAIVTCNVVDFIELAADAVARNAEHDGIILVPSSFQTDEFEAIADGLERVVHQYPAGLPGTVVYLSRVPR